MLEAGTKQIRQAWLPWHFLFKVGVLQWPLA